MFAIARTLNSTYKLKAKYCQSANNVGVKSLNKKATGEHHGKF
jgi:hypothetical protein